MSTLKVVASKLSVFLFLVVFLILAGSLMARADSILMIGDSLSCLERTFGPTMVKNMAAAGHSVTLYCAPSAKAKHWIKGEVPAANSMCRKMDSRTMLYTSCNAGMKMPSLKELLDKNPKSRVVVELGTNSLFSSLEAEYPQFLDMIKSRKCAWIGPPNIRPDQTNPRVFRRETLVQQKPNVAVIDEALKTASKGKCSYFTSTKATAVGKAAGETADGVHRGPTGGSAWANEISKDMSAWLAAAASAPRLPIDATVVNETGSGVSHADEEAPDKFAPPPPPTTSPARPAGGVR